MYFFLHIVQCHLPLKQGWYEDGVLLALTVVVIRVGRSIYTMYLCVCKFACVCVHLYVSVTIVT